MATIIKNSGSDWVLADTNPRISISANSQYDLENDLSLAQISLSDQLMADLATPGLSLACNDGSRDLTTAQALRHLLQKPNPGPVDPQDGKPLFATFPATDGLKTHMSGAGDNTTPDPGESGISEGQDIELSCTGEGSDELIEWSYNKPNQVHGGELNWDSDQFNGSDKFAFSVRLPANTPTVNGTTTGNCNVVSNVIVPANGDGGHDIDLATAIPLKAPDKDGYWDIDQLTGAITPSLTPGSALFHLLDVEKVVWICRRIALASKSGQFKITAYRVEWTHQSWKFRLHCKKNSTGPGTLYGWLFRFVKSQE